MSRRWGTLVGPLGRWELVRLARRGQVHRARLLVLYFLLPAFVLTPLVWFPNADPVGLFAGGGRTVPAAEAARFAARVALVLVEAVLLAVVAMTPGYAAAAVSEEKERDTLTVLLTTGLSDWEIVAGKLVGRVGFVLAAAGAGAPVVAVTLVFGGVDPLFLLAGGAAVGSTAVLAGAVGVSAGCVAPDLRAAVLRAYGLTAVVVCGAFVPPCVLLSPFAVLAWLEQPEGGNLPVTATFAVGGVAYPAVQLLAAVGFLAFAARNLRLGEGALARLPAPVAPPAEWQAVLARAGYEGRPVPDLPPVDEDDPLLWKERHVTGRKAGAAGGDGGKLAGAGLGGLAALLVVLGGIGLVAQVFGGGRADDGSGRLMMTGGTIAGGVYLTTAAVGLAPAVARERHRKTLDALLAIPAGRRAILRAKVRAATERGRWLAAVAVLAAGVSFGADGGWRLGLAAAAYAAAGVGLVVGGGAWLTVRCPTEVRALRFLAPAVVLAAGAPVGVWNLTDWRDPRWSAAGLAATAMVFAVAGRLGWRQAGRDLERYGGADDRA